MAIRVFISHSAKDEALASAVVDFLLANFVLADEEIRCTSVPGHKLPVGSDSASTLRDNLGESAVVVGLITKSALSSGWVLFELGAAWGSKKHLMPLIAGDVDFKDLPGPLSGQHVAKLSSKEDLSQFVDEIAKVLGAQRRAAAKSAGALDSILASHEIHVKNSTAEPAKVRVEAKAKEPQFSGMPFSELMGILNKEIINIPAELSGQKSASEQSIFSLFVANSRQFATGVQSNYDEGTAGDFMYREIGLRLLPYGLVQFEKLPAAQAKFFKRLVVSAEGNKFLLHWNRISAANSAKKSTTPSSGG